MSMSLHMKFCKYSDLNLVFSFTKWCLLGNFRSALNDVTAARKLKPCHLKAIVRGEYCRTTV